MISFQVKGADRTARNMKRGRDRLEKDQKSLVHKAALHFEGAVKRSRFSKYGRHTLAVGTGHARASIHTALKVKQREVTGIVGTPLFYVRVHEEGKTIYPKRKRYLRFKGRKGWATVESVTLPRRQMFELERARQVPAIQRILGGIVRSTVRVANGGS